jgi:hypothetical protein
MRAVKARGARFEQDVCDWLATHGFPHAERRHLRGNHDRGDVAGVPSWVLEIKNVASVTLGAFVDEAAREAANDGAEHYAAVIRRRGQTDTGQSYVVMPLHVFARWAAL